MTKSSIPTNIIFAGTPHISAQVLTNLLQAGIKFSAVLTQVDRQAGRGKKLQPSAVKLVALKHNIPIIQVESFKEASSLALIEQLKPELIIVVAYGLILPPSLLAIPKLGCINMHVSLLPKYRGAAPIQRAILNGDRLSGVTIMQIDPGLDTGDILLQKTLEIDDFDTSGSLANKMADLGVDMLLEYLNTYTTVIARPQVSDAASYAAKITKLEAKINWSNEATYIANQVRAFNPNPGCFCYLNGEVLKLWHAQAIINESSKAEIGTIINCNENGIDIMCANNTLLRVTQLQLAGKTKQTAQTFILGKNNLLGSVLT